MFMLKSLSPRRSMHRFSVAALTSILTVTGIGLPIHQAAAVNYTLATCDASELRSTFLTAKTTTANDTIFLKAGCNYIFTDAAEGDTVLNFTWPVNLSGTITIEGNGSTISRSSANGTPNLRFLFLREDSSTRLNDLTISNFSASSGNLGGAIYGLSEGVYTLDVADTIFISNSAGAGGAVSCSSPDSTCNFTRTAFLQNSTPTSGGDGGALRVGGNSTINQSAFFGNVAGRSGGALDIEAEAVVTIVNTTFAGNSADDYGGAIRAAGTVLGYGVTIYGNTVGLDADGEGTGAFLVWPQATTAPTFYNSIIAGNMDDMPDDGLNPDYWGALNANSRNTIIGNNSGMTGITNGVNGNQVGTAATPIDPRLTCVFPRPGGIIPACVPLGNSPAINAGSNAYQFDNVDTRGVRRRLYGTIDIGAAEFKRPDSPVVTNAANQAWLFRYTSTAGAVDMNFLYGQGLSDYNPIVGDWNADGIDTQGIYTRFNNNNIGVFALSNTFNSFDVNTLPAFVYTDASPNWIPVAGDWNGDAFDSVGAYNVSTGVWVLTNSNASIAPSFPAFAFGGGAGIVPVTGDWDGNGTDRIGLYNFNTSTWLLSNTIGAGAPVEVSFTYGAPGSYPIVGDWNGDGVDTVGLYNPTSGQWLLRNTNTTGSANVAFVYGQGAGLRGEAGQWKQVTLGNGTSPIKDAPATTPTAPQIAPTFAP